MTNAIKVLLQMQSGFLQLESTLHTYKIDKKYEHSKIFSERFSRELVEIWHTGILEMFKFYHLKF
jgi:hypothetical protein